VAVRVSSAPLQPPSLQLGGYFSHCNYLIVRLSFTSRPHSPASAAAPHLTLQRDARAGGHAMLLFLLLWWHPKLL
jgi:hypothetical protein